MTHRIPQLKADIEELRKSVPTSTAGEDGDTNGGADSTPAALPKSATKKRPAKAKADDAEGEDGASPTKKAKTPAKPRGKKAAAAAAKEKEDGEDKEATNGDDAENEAVEAAENLTIASPTKGKAKSPAKPRTPAKKTAASTKKGTATTTKKAGAAKKAANIDADGEMNGDDENTEGGEGASQQKEDVEMGDGLENDDADNGVDDEIAKRKDIADGKAIDEVA